MEVQSSRFVKNLFITCYVVIWMSRSMFISVNIFTVDCPIVIMYFFVRLSVKNSAHELEDSLLAL